jgi:hypothetical protein
VEEKRKSKCNGMSLMRLLIIASCFGLDNNLMPAVARIYKGVSECFDFGM